MNIVLALLGLVVVLIVSPGLAYLSQPWSPWWIGQQSGPVSVPIGGGVVDVPGIGVAVPPVISGAHVTDAERYALALAAGFSPADAITATAISIAEDGSGDPAALSGLNFNNTRDLGLWQINSIHWADYGGHDALTVPLNNARAAFGIAGPHLNWCAWSTYEVSCGRGYTGAYAQYLPCARAISEGATCRR